MIEVSSIENQYIGRMRELDQFVRETTQGDEFPMEIVDHDFAPGHTPMPSRPDSLSGFDAELERLQGDISNQEVNAEGMHHNLASARLAIGALDGDIVIGKTIGYQDFVERVTGFRPEITPDEELDRQKEEIAEIVSRLGYRYTEEDREAFNDRYAIGSEEMQSAIEGLVLSSRGDLAKAVGAASLRDIDEPRIEVKNEKYMWQAYFGTDENKEFFIKANSNPLLRISSLLARIGMVHERGHHYSSASRRLGIADGEHRPDEGIMPSFSPRYTLEEIIARTVEEYTLAMEVAEQSGDSDFAEYLYKSLGYEIDVRINTMIMANSSNCARDEVIQYGRRYLPYDEPEKTEGMIDEFRESLLFKTFFAVDGHTIRQGRRIASLPDDERQAELARLVRASTLPADLRLAAKAAF